ncbi:FAD-dependent oxidoreductase [Streptomyces abyssomicinicus]|uniref:FAD-dependent oxidoreductase n=1 Tax=Streptomyces abyssomicinicus TaxID=574929 RepID=UPI00124FC0D4|nr:FAD-dependent oxidoreductase [Streptomyces abyssomicinicus]
MAEKYDVVVVGGGSAGVAAAVGARRAGARTLLLERGPCLGGAATLRNVLTYCGIYTREDEPRQVVFGVAEEVLSALREEGAVSAPQRFNGVCVVFEPEAVKRALDTLCAAAGVDVRLHSHVSGAHRVDGRITRVSVAGHRGVTEVAADAFVDASGEADLAAFAGAAVRYGTDGMVQNGSLGVRFGGIPRHVDVSRAQVSAAVHTARARGVSPLVSAHGLVARLPVSGDVIAYIVDEAYDARDAADVSRAEARARVQAHAYLDVIRSLPGAEGAYIVSTGPELGTRESRHVIARYRLGVDEVLGAARFHDAVAVGAWPVEYHPGPGRPSEWHFIKGDGYYEIPLGSLWSADTDNLFAAGRNVDGDRLAGASLRVMGTAFATGQAAGVAAAVVADGGTPDGSEVGAELRRQGAVLPEPALL